VGALMMGFAMAGNVQLVTLAVAVAIGVGFPMFPPVFRRLVKLTKLHRLHPEIDSSLEGLNVSTLLPYWGTIALGWLVMGFSLWAALRAIPGIPTPPVMPRDFPLLTACIALSTVAGFVSGLPGGLGARELVVVALVQPNFGPLAAMLLAVVHRGVIILIELVVAGVLLVIRRPPDSADASATTNGLKVEEEVSAVES
jgi:glycosyltransferase 2 family protein